ncbi:MAG: methylenetetrahydrofolate reductase [NAD(P)H], partial [Planctomycetales bacterium]
TSFGPDFITCTYGAGGSTRDTTLDVVTRVKETFGLPTASHLTCVGATKDELRSYLQEAQQRNIDYIVALRGDPPQGETEFKPVPGGLRYANELTALIRAEFPDFGIAVAGYPETHQEAPNPEEDLANLKRKVEAGADVVVTQLFYDNDDLFRFRDRYDAAGIKATLVPGILPVTNLAQIKRITSMCGAKLPQALADSLAEQEDNAEAQFEIGVRHAVEQVQSLIDAGVPGLHFYVLNKSQATSQVLRGVQGWRREAG